jgi:hypothetical protein
MGWCDYSRQYIRPVYRNIIELVGFQWEKVFFKKENFAKNI